MRLCEWQLAPIVGPNASGGVRVALFIKNAVLAADDDGCLSPTALTHHVAGRRYTLLAAADSRCL